MARSFGERFGARLRAGRRALGMSQEELAQKAGLSANYIGLIERGVKQPTLDSLARIAAAVQLSVGNLLGEGDEGDDWLDEVRSVARTVPTNLKPIALAVLRTIAEGQRGSR